MNWVLSVSSFSRFDDIHSLISLTHASFDFCLFQDITVHTSVFTSYLSDRIVHILGYTFNLADKMLQNLCMFFEHKLTGTSYVCVGKWCCATPTLVGVFVDFNTGLCIYRLKYCLVYLWTWTPVCVFVDSSNSLCICRLEHRSVCLLTPTPVCVFVDSRFIIPWHTSMAFTVLSRQTWPTLHSFNSPRCCLRWYRRYISL